MLKGFFKIFSKKKMFGQNVEESCSHCKFNTSEDDIECNRGDGSVCKFYEYDPLKRRPGSNLPLKNYDADEFSL